MPKGKLAVEISKDAKSNLAREITRLEAKVMGLEGKLKTVGNAGQRAGKQHKGAFGPGALSSLKSYVGGVASVGTAIMALKSYYNAWRKDIRETSTEARKAAGEYVALAALQAGGGKAEAVRKATALASKYGVAERGVAYDIVQAMQSRYGGDLSKGLAAAGTVFAATQVGIPVELGKELEVLGGAQKQKTGQALRRAYVAGQLSERDPATMARAAPALKFWKDKDVGFAAAAAIAASVQPEKVETQTRSGAIALGVLGSKGFQKTIKKLGLADATQLEKLRGIRDAGIVTTEQLGAAGLTEQRQVEAMSTLLLNVDRIGEWTKVIRERATPGLFARERGAIEKEIPATRIARRIDEVSAEYMSELAFGDRSQEAMAEELRERMRGLALRRMGRQRGLFYEGEEGRAGPWDWAVAGQSEKLQMGAAARAWQPDGLAVPAAGKEIEREIAELLRGPAEALQQAANDIREAAGQMKGGPTMVAPTEDR